MLKSKTKGLFLDISEYSVLAARTSGYKLPFVVEELKELPLDSHVTADDLRAFFEELVDFQGAAYFVSRCGVYPQQRMVRFYEVESASKAKDLGFLVDVMQEEFGLDPNLYNVSLLSAYDGSDFDGQKVATKQLVYCGAPTEEFEKEQQRLLAAGIYPSRLELSTVTTLGGLCDYARFAQIKGPVLCLELASEVAMLSIQSAGHVEVARPIPFGLDSIYPLLQRELGLKDEQSARKLFFSNTFDFAEMGSKLLRRITKEVQAAAGFYEVQTGQAIEAIFLPILPKNLAWIGKSLSDSLGLEVLRPDFEAWMESLDVKMDRGVDVSMLNARWLSLFALMGEYQLREEVQGG